MNNKPKFSIITVTYNAASVIEPTLQSILAQSYRNIEFLLIDGGSSDNTVEVVKKSGVEIAVLVSERDKGLYDAMNKGIARATGDYLCFLNAGDSFHAPDVLEKMAACCAEGAELLQRKIIAVFRDQRGGIFLHNEADRKDNDQQDADKNRDCAGFPCFHERLRKGEGVSQRMKNLEGI